MKKKIAVLLVNLGTPDSYTLFALYRYLVQFLNDRRVIDLPWLQRLLLVNLIIIPARLRKSSARYRSIWTEKGSPLMFHTLNLQKRLQESVAENISVHVGMRYGNPSIANALRKIHDECPDSISVIPLFPQYASSTNGSITEEIMKEMQKWNALPTLRILHDYSDYEGYLKAFAARILECKPEKYDHVLFSFHSLPVRHIQRIHPQVDESECDCHRAMPNHGHLCYKALCYSTARGIAGFAEIEKHRYTVCFQSRFSNKWISPYTEETIVKKAKEGIKSLLIVAPSFTTDGLETISDLALEGSRLFKANGGKELKLVESLNDSKLWVEALGKIIQKESLDQSGTVFFG